MKKDSEKEQKQSLSKTEECSYAFSAVLNQKREQNLCCSPRAVEHRITELATSMKQKPFVFLVL